MIRFSLKAMFAAVTVACLAFSGYAQRVAGRNEAIELWRNHIERNGLTPQFGEAVAVPIRSMDPGDQHQWMRLWISQRQDGTYEAEVIKLNGKITKWVVMPEA